MGLEWVNTVLQGALLGGIYALFAAGLSLMFGVMRIVNIAHGDFLMLGGYAAYWLFTLFGMSPFLAAVLVLVVFLAVGWPLYYLIVPRLQLARDAEMLSLILFFGLSQVIEALATIAFGTTEHSIPGRVLGIGPFELLGAMLPKAWGVSALVSAIAVGAVALYLYRTRLGTLTRAVMVNRDEALASGIDTNRVSAIAFGIGIALAGLAGVFAPFMLGSMTPSMGVDVNLAAFAVIVVGSLGNPLGTALGGMIYGVSLLLMQTYLSSWANLLPNLMLILVLLVWPTGILGREVRRA